MFLYLSCVTFTKVSLVGYWTDIIFSIIIVLVVGRLVLFTKREKHWLSQVLRGITIASIIYIFGLLFLNLINSFAWDTLKMKSFYYQNIDERLFNAYFKPVGSYAGGEGSFWITESPKYFPIIEIEKHYDRTVLWDFRIKEWEGEPINQNNVVKSYVKDEIINKGK